MSRRVFTRAENKKVWGKRPESLASTLDLDGVLEVWKEGVKNVVVGGKRGKGGKGKEKEKGGNVNLSVTDDVGNYVCGFLYYASLLEMGKREDGRRNVVFLHVPLLETEEELEKGRLVVMALITALAEVNGRVGD